jgi:hypothetical protein
VTAASKVKLAAFSFLDVVGICIRQLMRLPGRPADLRTLATMGLDIFRHVVLIQGEGSMKILITMFLGVLAFVSAAAAQIVVTPLNAASLGFSTADTRPGGSVNFVLDGSLSGGGLGSLNLSTDNSTSAKAQFLKADNLSLSSLTNVSYYSKKNSGPVFANVGFNIATCLGGFTTPTETNPTGCVAFTTLVFEPYQASGICCTNIPTGTWQNWDVFGGAHWSSRTTSAGGSCSVTAGAGGAPFYSLSSLAANCPSAVVVGYGFNVGSNNPAYDISADLMTVNGTTFDFEPYQVVTNKDQCKNGGWQYVTRQNATPFRNQGDCIQYVNTGR